MTAGKGEGQAKARKTRGQRCAVLPIDAGLLFVP
jgi:hypothetical protein